MNKTNKPALHSRLALFWCLLPALLAILSARAQEPVELTYLVNQVAAEPYQVITENGNHEGLVTEIVWALLEGVEAHWQVEAHPYRRVQRILANDDSGNWLCYGATRWLLPDALARSTLLEPALFITRYQLVGRREGPQDPVADARNSRIIVIHGYRYGDEFEQWLHEQGHEVVDAPSHHHALAMLRQRRGDYYLAEDIRVEWEIARAGGGREDLAIHDFSALMADTSIHLIHNRDLPAPLASKLGQRLRTLEASGKLDAIRHRYLAH